MTIASALAFGLNFFASRKKIHTFAAAVANHSAVTFTYGYNQDNGQRQASWPSR